VLVEDQVLRRVAWLQAALEEVTGLETEALNSDTLQVTFATPAEAQRFGQALVAESMPALVDAAGVLLRVETWYSPSDIQALALAAAKVAYYLMAE
jgi:hypothetical protein